MNKKSKKNKKNKKELNEMLFLESRHNKQHMRNKNVARFRKDFPLFNKLTHQQILLIFKMYKNNRNRTFFASDISMLFAGTLIILITSLFMVAGGTMRISEDTKTPNQVVMNTVISAASSGFLVAITTQYQNSFDTKSRIQDRQILYHFNVHQLCNSVLAGMVSVTASCNNIELWAAAAVGIIGSTIYTQMQKLISRFEIDDPLDISEVHGFCGIWAIIAAGIFDKTSGFFYTGNARQLGI